MLFGEKFYSMLNKMPAWRHSLYALVLATRQYPNFALWCELQNSQGRTEYLQTLKQCWRYHFDKYNHIDLEEALELVEPYLPMNLPEYTEGDSFAFDAGVMIEVALESVPLNAKNAQNAALASISSVIRYCENVYPEQSADEEQLLELAPIQAEIEYQVELFNLVMKPRSPENIKALLQYALEDGVSNIGLENPLTGEDFAECFVISRYEEQKAPTDGASPDPWKNSRLQPTAHAALDRDADPVSDDDFLGELATEDDLSDLGGNTPEDERRYQEALSDEGAEPAPLSSSLTANSDKLPDTEETTAVPPCFLEGVPVNPDNTVTSCTNEETSSILEQAPWHPPRHRTPYSGTEGAASAAKAEAEHATAQDATQAAAMSLEGTAAMNSAAVAAAQSNEVLTQVLNDVISENTGKLSDSFDSEDFARAAEAAAWAEELLAQELELDGSSFDEAVYGRSPEPDKSHGHKDKDGRKDKDRNKAKHKDKFKHKDRGPFKGKDKDADKNHHKKHHAHGDRKAHSEGRLKGDDLPHKHKHKDKDQAKGHKHEDKKFKGARKERSGRPAEPVVRVFGPASPDGRTQS